MKKIFLISSLAVLLLFACGRKNPAGPAINTPTLTATQQSTATQTFTAMPTGTSTCTNTPADTYTCTETGTETVTNTAVDTNTHTVTETATETATPSVTLTDTPTATPTSTNTLTPTATNTHTATETPVFTFTSTFTATLTITLTLAPTPTNTTVPIALTGGVRFYANGTYANTCKAYRLSVLPYVYQGDTGDGYYRLNNPAGGTMDCYCDMTTDGGGWTMVANFKYPANYENIFFARNNSTYGTGNPDPNVPTAWSDWRVLNYVSWPLEAAVILDMASYSSSWESYTKKVIYRFKNRNVMPHSGIASDLLTGDNLYYKIYPTDGWADVGTSSAGTVNLWYATTVSNAYLALLHDTNNYATYNGSGMPAGDDTWYHSSYWLVR